VAFQVVLPDRASPQSNSSAASFSTLSKRAAEARDADRLDEAAALYTKALALRPRWTDGWWSLGTIQYDQDHYADAARSFQRVVLFDPRNGTAHAMLGLCQFELGKDDLSLKHLLAAEQFGILKNVQLRTVALYHLGALQLRAGRYGAARESFAQLVKDRIRTPELISGLGLAALFVKSQQAPAQGTPGAAVVERAGEAEALLIANEFGRAKQQYRQLVGEFPGYPNLHFAFGRLLLQTDDNDEAIRQFQLELKRDPQHVNSMLQIAVAREQLDPQDGLKYAEGAARLAPGLPFAHYILGKLRLDTGNAAAAIPELEVARKSFPNEAGIYFALGKAYAQVGRKAEAAKARAEFARLNALAAKQQGPTVYGSETRTLDKEKLQE
jgi:tetratricopeptide (TPR) repeat protein